VAQYVLQPGTLSKILSHLRSRMKDADSTVRDACTEVLAGIARELNASDSPLCTPDQHNPLIK
jgi:hypothetical protein